MAADNRNYAQSAFQVEVGGSPVGHLYKVTPFNLELDTAELKMGHDYGTMKTTANMKWTEATFEVGMFMGKAMSDWITQSFQKSHVYKDGAIVMADANFKAQRRLDWLQALITSVSFAKVEASSKDVLKITVKAQAESVRWAKGGGEDISASMGKKVKAWAASNFRFELGSLPCNNIVSVDAIEWKQKTVYDMVGTIKENSIIPTALETPDIKLTIQNRDLDAWANWAKGWGIDGNSLQEHELSGSLTYLNQAMQPVGSLTFQNVGLKKFELPALERGDKPHTFNVTLYCEDIKAKLDYIDA